MIRIYNRQPDLWESLLPPNLRELPKELKLIDEILTDPIFTTPFEKKLKEKVEESLFSKDFGRPSTFIASYIRLMYLKFRHQLSYEGLLEDVTYCIAKRRFCGFTLTEPLPDDTTLIKLTHKLGEDFIKELFNATIKEAYSREFIKGKKSRFDTFVLKSNIHYPTDSTLLYDGIRVISNISKRLKTLIPTIKEKSYNYGKKAKRILLHLNLKLKNSNQSSPEVLHIPTNKTKALQEKLIALAEKSILRSRRFIEDSKGLIKERAKEIIVKKTFDRLVHFTELTEKIVSQTKEVLSGNTHIKDRLVSIFDTGARPIKKGKTFPKVEFGRKVLISEGENGIITHLNAFEGNPNDHTLLVDGVRAQEEVVGQIPESVAADRGFYDTSHTIQEELKSLGVKHLSIPARGYKDTRQKKREWSKCFRDLQRWRAAQEAKISLCMRRFGMGKSLMRGTVGANLWLLYSGFSHNLWQMARLMT